MNRNFGITRRLTVIFVVFAAVLLAGVSLLAYENGRQALEAATLSELSSTAIEKQAALNAWVDVGQTDIARLAGLPSTVATVSALMAAVPGSAPAQAAHDQLIIELKAYGTPSGSLMDFQLMEPVTAQVLAATNPIAEGQFREDQPYFIQGKVAPYVQNVYFSLASQGPAMTAAAPVRAADGRLLAVLAGQMSLAEMNTILQRRTALHQTDDAFLVNTSNLFVTQPRLVTDPAVLQRGVHTQAVQACLTGASGAIQALDYRDVPAIIVYRWLPERNLCLIVKLDQAEAQAPVRQFGLLLGGVSGLALLVAAAVAVGLARTFTRPILALRAGVARFAQGDLSSRLPEHAGDELGQLAQEFNRMAASLTEKDAQLRGYAAELEQKVEVRTAELRRSNAELEQFAYVASHDLQEPLRMVSSYMQLIAQRYQGRLDADADEFIDYAVDGANRMKRLISDLLAYSRVGTRGQEFARTECEAVLQQALDNLQLVIEETRASVTHASLPAVMADGAQLLQLFQNLIGNALKFHGDEPPCVQIGAVARGQEWLFSVADNGIGLDMQYAERIFVIFQRLHGRDEFPGTGIGLAICKKIVERHGGRLWVESQPGQGATFHFTLPANGGLRPKEVQT